jgi:hypothetical protein
MKKLFAFSVLCALLLAYCEMSVWSDDATNPATALGKTYSLDGIELESQTSYIEDIKTFSGTVWDTTGTVQLGTITNGILNLELPAVKGNNLYSPSRMFQKGVKFNPSSVKVFFAAWMKVKAANAKTADYALHGLSPNSSWVYFIYSNGDAVAGGTQPDGKTMTDQYELDLKTGWNWAEWGWPSDSLRTCKSVKSSEYTWSISDN